MQDCLCVLERLSFSLPKHSLSYASILPKYSNYLYDIGEHLRAFYLVPKLIDELFKKNHLPNCINCLKILKSGKF